MKVSILTLTLDRPAYFDEAIASVPHDLPVDIEHIVVHDGDPTFAEMVRNCYPSLKLIMGDGGGATAALARAVDEATGDFLLILHSDDRLGPQAISRLVQCAAARPEVLIWSGQAHVFRIGTNGQRITERVLSDRVTTELSLTNICDDLPLHTARFCHSSLFRKFGNYDPCFTECSDREWLLRIYIGGGIIEAPLDVLVSELRQHDQSRTINTRRDWVPPYLAEHIKLADAWLPRREVAKETRRFLRAWRAREILRLAFYNARAGRLAEALRIVATAALSEPLWIFRASSAVSASRSRRRSVSSVPQQSPLASA